jgi:hypothetical protein
VDPNSSFVVVLEVFWKKSHPFPHAWQILAVDQGIPKKIRGHENYPGPEKDAVD